MMIISCKTRRLSKFFALIFSNFSKIVAGRAAANSSKKKRKIALPQNSKAGRKKSCKSRLKMNLTTSESPSRSIYWVTQCMTHKWYEFRRESRVKVPISNQIQRHYDAPSCFITNSHPKWRICRDKSVKCARLWVSLAVHHLKLAAPLAQEPKKVITLNSSGPRCSPFFFTPHFGYGKKKWREEKKSTRSRRVRWVKKKKKKK